MDAGSERLFGVVILAAGESARMGRPKQLLPFHGTTLLGHAISVAHTIDPARVVVVLGAQAERIRLTTDANGVTIVENAAWREGMGGSLRAGVRELSASPEIEAAVVILCDQPQVSSDLLGALVAAWRNGAELAASRYESRLGVPALFARVYFPELLALSGAAGARDLLARHADSVYVLPFPAGILDIDTPDQYAALERADA